VTANAPMQQALGRTDANGRGSDWRQALRMRVIEFGIEAIWGKSAFPATMAADVPLIRAGLRMAWIRALGAIGIRKYVAPSGLGYDFVCHIGDLAEYPYYHRSAFQHELAICAGWLREAERPVVYDVGANVGFFATQLAQILAGQSSQIYAFEPVPTTFAKLVQSVHDLGLSDRVHPVAAAILDDARPVHVSYCQRNSLYAQIVANGAPRPGDVLAQAPGMTLDGFHSFAGVLPALVKIDVEGSEVAVLRGAQQLLARPDRPALLFEYNPDTLLECGVAADSFRQLLCGYALHYVDDFEGRRMPFGSPLARVEESQIACNVFAVPQVEGWSTRWASALEHARSRLGSRA
jgi:FkbM family methyltransferase